VIKIFPIFLSGNDENVSGFGSDSTFEFSEPAECMNPALCSNVSHADAVTEDEPDEMSFHQRTLVVHQMKLMVNQQLKCGMMMKVTPALLNLKRMYKVHNLSLNSWLVSFCHFFNCVLKFQTGL